MFSSVITKNSNCEIFTKNLVTFKEKMGLRMKDFNIFGVYWKMWFSEGGGGGFTKNQTQPFHKYNGMTFHYIKDNFLGTDLKVDHETLPQEYLYR